jgi:shikimate kinase
VAVERVVLWGFMGCGKSVVGARLAERLGWEHVDLDHEIVRREGRSIAEIFHTGGEASFRRLEMEATRALIDRSRVVFSTGGGWITNPESLSLVPPRSLTVWLHVSPEVALSRVRADAGGAVRPMLDTPDPEAAARALHAAREPLYGRADVKIHTDGREVDALVTEIEAHVRRSAAAPQASPILKEHGDEG